MGGAWGSVFEEGWGSVFEGGWVVSVEDTWLWRRGKTGQGQEEEELGDTRFFISGHRKYEHSYI